MRRRYAFLFLFLFATSVQAEIYHCDGKWTNMPCSEKAEAKTLPVISHSGSADYGHNTDERSDQPASVTEEEQPTSGIFHRKKLARIRIDGKPMWRINNTSKGIQLNEAAVIVVNTSKTTAQDVEVVVKLSRRGGDQIVLKGPAQLPGRKSAQYKLEGSEKIPATARLTAAVSCSNCR